MCYPFDVRGASLHADLLALLGVALGELWFLDGLDRTEVTVSDCQEKHNA